MALKTMMSVAFTAASMLPSTRPRLMNRSRRRLIARRVASTVAVAACLLVAALIGYFVRPKLEPIPTMPPFVEAPRAPFWQRVIAPFRVLAASAWPDMKIANVLGAVWRRLRDGEQ